MRNMISPFLVTAALAAYGVAQEPAPVPALSLKLPPRVEVLEGQRIAVAAETNGKIVKWTCFDSGVAVEPVGDSKVVHVWAPKGAYTLLAHTCLENTPSDLQRVEVVVKSKAAPPDVKPDGPVVPPTNDLKGRLKTAYAKSPIQFDIRAKKLAVLRGLWGAAPDFLVSVTTVDQLLGTIRDAATRLDLKPGELQELREEIAAELQNLLPFPGEQVLTDATRAQAKVAFQTIATAIDAIQ